MVTQWCQFSHIQALLLAFVHSMAEEMVPLCWTICSATAVKPVSSTVHLLPTQDSNPTLRMLEYDASVKVSLNMYMYLISRKKRQKLIVVGIRNIVFQSTVSENKTKRNILKSFRLQYYFMYYYAFSSC